MSALLLFGDTERSAAMRHEVPAAIIDPFLFVELGGRKVVLTSELERERIGAALPGAELLDMFSLGGRERIEEGMSFELAETEAIVRALRQLDVTDTYVPGDFPVLI